MLVAFKLNYKANFMLGLKNIFGLSAQKIGNT
jgi:hypothetical protein